MTQAQQYLNEYRRLYNLSNLPDAADDAVELTDEYNLSVLNSPDVTLSDFVEGVPSVITFADGSKAEDASMLTHIHGYDKDEDFGLVREVKADHPGTGIQVENEDVLVPMPALPDDIVRGLIRKLSFKRTGRVLVSERERNWLVALLGAIHEGNRLEHEAVGRIVAVTENDDLDENTILRIERDLYQPL